MPLTPLARAALLIFLAAAAAAAAAAAPARGGEENRPANVTTPPPRDQFLILPLHVHVLKADKRPDIDCKLTDADVDRIIGKANRVWSMAGIAFRAESLLHEPAENVEKFDEQRKAAGPQALGVYRTLAPAATRDRPGFHVYYVHELPVNGVYLGGNVAFVKETAALRKVEGGIDEPIPRVTSHELGHALGLPHRQDTTNLMASGTTGTILNEPEVARTRGTANKSAGVLSPKECENAATEADNAKDADLAKRRRAAIPKP
jgi:hypothetical protein